MTGLYDAENKQHKDASVPRMKKDEYDVRKVMDTIESLMNPFKSCDHAYEPFSNIATGVKATDDIADHLLTAEQNDNATFTTVVEKRLQTRDVDLFAPLPKQNYRRSKTWSSQRKPKPLIVIWHRPVMT